MSDQIWTGDLNATARFNAQVGFYDTTLRDGEQTVGVVLDAEQKLEMTHRAGVGWGWTFRWRNRERADGSMGRRPRWD